jgi:hypothetical protein
MTDDKRRTAGDWGYVDVDGNDFVGISVFS